LIVLAAEISATHIVIVGALNNLIRTASSQAAVIDGVGGMSNRIPQADRVTLATRAAVGLRGSPRLGHAEAAVDPVGRPAAAS
jgi:hypothetical protein